MNAIDKPQARLIIEKEIEKAWMNVSSENGNLTIDFTDIEKTRRKYCKQLYANKFEKLDEMNKCLVKHGLQKATQEETENLNTHITIRHIQSIIWNCPKKITADSFTDKFCKTPKEEIIPILQTLLENKRYYSPTYFVKPEWHWQQTLAGTFGKRKILGQSHS